MLCRTVGAIAALTVGANAFLLPPGVKSIDDSAEGAGALVINPETQSIRLPCPGCVFSSKEDKATETEEGDGLVWAQGGANDVVLNFTVSEDHRAVNINGWQIYPFSLMGDMPKVDQLAASASFADLKATPELATAIEVSGASIFNEEEEVSAAGDKIVRVTYHIDSLEGQPMRLDSAVVQLLESADGTLMILSVDPVRSSMDDSLFTPPPPPPPPAAPKECHMLPAAMCNWLNKVEAKLQDFKSDMPPRPHRGGCHKAGSKGPDGARPHHLPDHIKGPRPEDLKKAFEEHENEDMSMTVGDDEIEDVDFRHHGPPPHPHGGPPFRPHHGPHGDGPHGPHGMGMHGPGPHPHHRHHHHHHHMFLHRLVRAFVAVLIPVMAGVTMGMFVSLVGMLVGRLIAFLWIKFARGGRRGYSRVALAEENGDVADARGSMDKGGDLEVVVVTEEQLPRYEDADVAVPAPAYEEKEVHLEERK